VKYEVEQKFRAASLTDCRHKIEQMGAVFNAPVTQTDLYLAHPSRNFGDTDEALRIRRTGDENRVTYKGPRIETTIKTRRELELPLLAGEAGAAGFRELFVSLGFTPVAEVHKVREEATLTFESQRVVAALDSVTGVGSFVELEIVASKDHIAAAQQVVASLAIRLALTEHESRSYLELLLSARGDI